MKHKHFKHLFTALLLLCTTVVTAHDFVVGGIYYNVLSEEEKTVEVTYKGTSYNQYSNEYTGSVVIPQSVVYNGKVYSVTSIGNDAFVFCSGLTSVTIPNSVTSIGKYAFNDCSGLTSVTIPNSVTSIGEGAFGGCSGLTSIEIPNSVTSIGDYAFSWCRGLTSIKIPNSVTSIGYQAFYGCSSLTSVVIGNSVISLGDYVFSGCSGLTSIIVEPGNPKYDSRENSNAIVETESNTLVAGCKTTVIPNSVTSIGKYAFYDCSGLKSITIPNSVTSIGEWAFCGCTGLTGIEIGNGVTSIGEGAFYYCYYLKTVINFSNLTFTKGYINYGYIAYYATKVINAPNAVIDGDFIWCKLNGANTLACYLGKATELTLPSDYNGGKYVIGDFAFSGCKGLTSITIPNSVTSIGDEAFYYCSGLTSITSLIPAEDLFPIDSYVFSGIDKTNCTLYVPYGAKETYAATEGWKEFANIVEMEPESQPGDINKDGEVNVGDFAALVNIIFNSESIDDTIKSVSDINADGEVNVGDFAALVNLIFNSGSQASPQRAATRAAADETTFYIEPFSIAAGETKVIPVLMENPSEKFSQLQFDITLPEGLEIPEYFDEEQFDDVKDIKRGSRTKSVYSIQTQPVGEALRVLCITQNSKAFFTGESGDVLLITVKATDDIALDDVDIKITNTVLSRQDGTTYKPADCTATVSVTDGTGIDEMKGENGEGETIYDLQGRKVEVSSEGLYIIDGKKVVVK